VQSVHEALNEFGVGKYVVRRQPDHGRIVVEIGGGADKSFIDIVQRSAKDRNARGPADLDDGIVRSIAGGRDNKVRPVTHRPLCRQHDHRQFADGQQRLAG
jgi:hypothetical protein